MERREHPFWLSFCNEETGAFLGVCLVFAKDEDMAIRAAWTFGCNPGGTVAIQKLSALKSKPLPPMKWFNRLLSRDDVKEMEREITSMN